MNDTYGVEEWVPSFPTWSDMVQTELRLVDAQLEQAGRHPLDLTTRGRIQTFEPREQFYMVHGLSRGPVRNVLNRLLRRMLVVDHDPEDDWVWNEDSESNVSTDSGTVSTLPEPVSEPSTISQRTDSEEAMRVLRRE